jgi:hypothetical protein
VWLLRWEKALGISGIRFELQTERKFMSIAVQKVKLTVLQAEYQVAAFMGWAKTRQLIQENLVICRTSLKVAREFEANNQWFNNLLIRSH